HLYYIENSGKMVGVTTTKTITHQPSVSHLQGKISIQHKTDKGFDVLITDIQSPKGISEVLLPIWSTQNGQDDIVWYQAHKTSNGDYVTSVTIKDHKNNTGEYAIHLYYKDKQGVLSGVATATTTIDKQSSLNYNGSYYSVTGKYGDEIIIVNKKHPLAAQYNPGEVAAAKSAFINLRNDMIRKGYNVGNHYSGFRSYDYQKTLYQNYVNRDGQAVADRYSARPGYSEHQTGLSFDMTDKAGNLLEDKAASRYLKDNAHHYGFIVRYQAGKEKETGFMPEAWHLRYVGQEAKDIYASGLSLEAYYGIEGGDYVNSRPNPSSTNALPSQGSYQFTKRAFIKTEPKMTSPDLAYYDAGNRVNYDKLVMADGHQWLSYLSYGGQRRYIAID
ncbi:LD-carboxypeptidase LdcB/DacB, partial [Streptococcus sp. zg-JUN1979]|uniref:LD-carboxypeptidase LdcB/DacB n=1 Tax=Streptococcus sp. zg-JUN1979 TaxID=3391450 RepID=UPI0039A6D61C